MRINVGMIVPCTEAEGPGRRFAVWTQGCTIRCPGCCNPGFFHHRDNDLRAPDEVADALAEAHAAYDLEGLSLLGGEPTEQAAALLPVVHRARALGLSVMLFSGHTLEELMEKGGAVSALLAGCDLLVDGRYEERQRTTARRYIGSNNQRLHFLSDRYAPDDPIWRTANTLEVRLRYVDGQPVFEMNGFPVIR